MARSAFFAQSRDSERGLRVLVLVGQHTRAPSRGAHDPDVPQVCLRSAHASATSASCACSSWASRNSSIKHLRLTAACTQATGTGRCSCMFSLKATLDACTWKAESESSLLRSLGAECEASECASDLAICVLLHATRSVLRRTSHRVTKTRSLVAASERLSVPG